MKRKRDGMNGLAESLGLPLDASRGETILTFVGRFRSPDRELQEHPGILRYIFKDPGWKIQAFHRRKEPSDPLL